MDRHGFSIHIFKYDSIEYLQYENWGKLPLTRLHRYLLTWLGISTFFIRNIVEMAAAIHAVVLI